MPSPTVAVELDFFVQPNAIAQNNESSHEENGRMTSEANTSYPNAGIEAGTDTAGVDDQGMPYIEPHHPLGSAESFRTASSTHSAGHSHSTSTSSHSRPATPVIITVPVPVYMPAAVKDLPALPNPPLADEAEHTSSHRRNRIHHRKPSPYSQSQHIGHSLSRRAPPHGDERLVRTPEVGSDKPESDEVTLSRHLRHQDQQQQRETGQAHGVAGIGAGGRGKTLGSVVFDVQGRAGGNAARGNRNSGAHSSSGRSVRAATSSGDGRVIGDGAARAVDHVDHQELERGHRRREGSRQRSDQEGMTESQNPENSNRIVQKETLSVHERMEPTIKAAHEEYDKATRQSQTTSYALNLAIGLQVLAGALTTGLGAALTGHSSSGPIAITILGGLSTLLASYLARARGSGEPESSAIHARELKHFIRRIDPFVLEHGAERGSRHDAMIKYFRDELEQILRADDGPLKDALAHAGPATGVRLAGAVNSPLIAHPHAASHHQLAALPQTVSRPAVDTQVLPMHNSHSPGIVFDERFIPGYAGLVPNTTGPSPHDFNGGGGGFVGDYFSRPATWASGPVHVPGVNNVSPFVQPQPTPIDISRTYYGQQRGYPPAVVVTGQSPAMDIPTATTGPPATTVRRSYPQHTASSVQPGAVPPRGIVYVPPDPVQVAATYSV